MDAVEDYARKWAKREKEDIETLSDWIRTIKSLILSRLRRLKTSMNSKAKSIFDDPFVSKTLPYLHDIYVIVPADKAPTMLFSSEKRRSFGITTWQVWQDLQCCTTSFFKPGHYSSNIFSYHWSHHTRKECQSGDRHLWRIFYFEEQCLRCLSPHQGENISRSWFWGDNLLISQLIFA